jgi:hypothetical protein
MAIGKPINSNASANNHLKLMEGEGLCCDETAVKTDYAVTVDTDTNGTAAAVNVTSGSTTSTVALTGAPIDWSDAANDTDLKDAIEKVATDLGYIAHTGGIEFSRSGNDLTIEVKDSTLVFNWIGTVSTNQNNFTGTAVI